LTAPFRCAQLAQPRMRQRGGGVIVNISSIHDEVARKGFAHYSVAKAGLKMLGRSAALEWAEFGIRVVTISPGAIETDINRAVIEDIGRDSFREWIPLGLGAPMDVARLVSFVCSDDARYITGTELYVDGGYSRNLVRYDGRP
ncbi:SDR family NAD(P)-dependent oxidoreductase, partial [Rhizobiaceae sp. 2RAB30]